MLLAEGVLHLLGKCTNWKQNDQIAVQSRLPFGMHKGVAAYIACVPYVQALADQKLISLRLL